MSCCLHASITSSVWRNIRSADLRLIHESTAYRYVVPLSPYLHSWHHHSIHAFMQGFKYPALIVLWKREERESAKDAMDGCRMCPTRRKAARCVHAARAFHQLVSRSRKECMTVYGNRQYTHRSFSGALFSRPTRFLEPQQTFAGSTERWMTWWNSRETL